MATKIEVITNSVVVTDTVGGNVLFEAPKKDVYFDSLELDNNANIKLTSSSNPYSNTNFYIVALASAVDAGSIAYTAASWRTFARTNLGA